MTLVRNRQKEMWYKCGAGPEIRSLVVSKADYRAERVVPLEQQHWKTKDKPQVLL